MYLHVPTNLDIDQRLLEQAVKVSGERTKTAAVTRALRDEVRVAPRRGWRGDSTRNCDDTIASTSGGSQESG